MDIQLVRDQEAEKIRDRIKRLKQQMYYAGMSDDYYYTNGKRDADLTRLADLNQQLRDLEQ